MKSKEMQQEYLRQISQLQAENEHLCTLNSQLQSSVDQLHAKKQEQVSRFEELITLYQQQLVDQRREIEGLSNQLKSLELQPQETPQPRGVDELGQSGTSVEKVRDVPECVCSVNSLQYRKSGIFILHEVPTFLNNQ